MNLGPQKISDTYKFVLNQSGSNVTLGDNAIPNWIGTTIASATGTQTISGAKTFKNNAVFEGTITTPNVYINNSASDASLEIGGGGNVYIDLKKPYSDDYDLRISTDGNGGFLSSRKGITIQTNNVDRLTIDESGNTTIGPGSGLSLNVKGGIRAEGGGPGANGSNNNGYAFSSPGDSDAGMFSSADGRIEFYTNNTERFRISGANIGIGLTDPKTILHAAGEITSSSLGAGGGNFRMVGTNYSALFRNSNDSLFLLCTNSADQYGSYNALRPFTVNLGNGNVSISTPLTISNTTTTNNLVVGTQTNKATISYATNTARTFTLPDVTANSTFAFINQAQTFTSNQAINANLRVQGSLDFGASTLGGTAHSNFLKTNAGQLGTTAGNTLNLASIGFANNNQSSLSFIARRQSNGSDWTTAAIALSYNVDNTAPVNNQLIWMLPNGNVGIGTDNATQKLEVQGNLKVNGSITTQSIISTNGISIPNVSLKLTSDVDMRNGNTWYDVLSISLGAGIWLVNSSFLYSRTNNVATEVACRVTDGVNHYASAQGRREVTNNSAVSLSTTTIITLGSTTTIKLQGLHNAANTATNLLSAARVTTTSLCGLINGATQITAIKIGP